MPRTPYLGHSDLAAAVEEVRTWEYPGEGTEELRDRILERFAADSLHYVLASTWRLEAGAAVRGDSNLTENPEDDGVLVLANLAYRHGSGWHGSTSLSVTVDNGQQVERITLFGRNSGQREVRAGTMWRTYADIHARLEEGRYSPVTYSTRYDLEELRLNALRTQAVRILGKCATDEELTNKYADPENAKHHSSGLTVKPV